MTAVNLQQTCRCGVVVFLWVVSVSITASRLDAQPRPGYEPTSTHIFPAGGRRGSTVQVLVGTECAPPGTEFLLDGNGAVAPGRLEEEVFATGEPSLPRRPTEIPITYPRQWTSKITIAADAELGPVFWRLSCAQGGTASRPFLIGDLPEWIETESNSRPEDAETVSLPVTLNGQIHGERDVDFFRFTANKGETICCEVLARRLGSPLDPLVSLVDESGRPMPVQELANGDDPILVMQAPHTGNYLLRVANLSFRGDPSFVYRINLERGRYVQAAFPATGQPGSTQEVEFLLADGSGEPTVVQRRVDFPNSADGSFPFHPPDREFLGTTLQVDSRSYVIESEPNQPADSPQTISAGGVLGRFDTPPDLDRFQFESPQGAVWSIRCRAFPPGNPALPVIRLLSHDGRELAECRSISAADGVCRINWTAPEARTYLLEARDLAYGSRGGPDFQYRLILNKNLPDFTLETESDHLNLGQGQTGKLKVTARRSGGCEGPIELQLSGLPDGIEVTGNRIEAGKQETEVVLKVSDSVAARPYDLILTGRAEVSGREIVRTARGRHLGHDSLGVSVGPARLERLHLTVTHKPLFRLYCQEAYQYAHRGSVFLYPMEIERLDGFDGEITLQIGDRQNRDLDGIQMRKVTVGPQDSEVLLPIYLPETMAINVQSQSQLYSQAYARFRDRHDRPQSVLVLSEKRNMIRTLPPVVKLTAVDERIEGTPGGDATCRLLLERTSNFPGAMSLALVEAPEGIEIAPAAFSAGETEASLQFHMAAGLHPGTYPITVRGTGFMGDTETISEAHVRLEIR